MPETSWDRVVGPASLVWERVVGTSAPVLAFLGWVSSALRTGGPGVAVVLSVWVLVAPRGECVLSHPVLQGAAAPTGTTDVAKAYNALNRSTNRVDAIGTTGYSYVQ